jgi:hypothetical protein
MQAEKLGGPRQVSRHNPKQKKQYSPPQFTILTARQAKAKLAEKGLPCSADVERLFRLLADS